MCACASLTGYRLGVGMAPSLIMLTVSLLLLVYSTVALSLSPSNNCSLNHTVRADDACVRSSYNQYSTCTEFSTFLESFNKDGLVSDCLLLTLEPGVYSLPPTQPPSMRYSVLIASTPLQDVVIRCLDTYTDPSSVNFSSEEYFVQLRFGGASVSLEGITFEGCSGPLEFTDMESVVITNCSFSGYTGSAVDLSNVNTIEIRDSSFDNCTTNVGKSQFRGNSGALSITYYSLGPSSSLSCPTALITNCVFTNNKAILPPGISRVQLNQALNNNIYYGRGGAVGFFVQESYKNVSVTIEDCLFDRNLADSFGGSLYLNLAGENTTHTFQISRTTFTRNEAGEDSYGGAVQMALLVQNIDHAPSRFDFTECLFEENLAEYGGGLSAVQTFSQGAGNLVTVSECTFLKNRARNVGSAVLFASFLYVQNQFESYQYRSHNNLFSNNTAPGGTFGVAFINVNFSGHNRFEFNEGPGLRVVGAQMDLLPGGQLSFLGNNAESSEGGALFLQDFGQIKLYFNSSMEFINNTGRIGSAIVVDVQRSSQVFSQLIFNPQCFLIHEQSSLSPRDWNDVSITFSGNSASVGPAVYISHLDHCSWLSATNVSGNSTNEVNVTFARDEFPSWAVFQYKNNSNTASSHGKEPMASKFYFQTEPVRITSTNGTAPLPVRPGEQSRLNLRGLDQFGNPAYIIVRLSDSRTAINTGAFSQAGTNAIINSTDSDQIQFEPSLLPIQPSAESVMIEYGFPALTQEQLFHEDEVVKVVIDTPYNVKSAEQFVLNFSLVACQPGFVLRNRTDGDRLVSCRCSRDEYSILDCEEDVIILRDGYWAGKEREPTPHLDFTPCPASYCRCHYRGGQICETLFFQRDPTLNLQCHPLRNGTLCGGCVNGTGVGVLRTNCRQCDTQNFFALGFLVVGDVILVTLILVLVVKAHIVFPSSLKGFLFYIQTVYYATEHFPISFWDIRKYMLFVSSGIGLYFPWDFCLFPSMTPIVSFAPKFTPAVIATVASVIAIVIVYVTRSRNGREYIWHGVWSLILLLYAPLAHTSLSLLHCRYTPSAAGTEEAYHWYLDGEVECFLDPSHTALGVIAIFVLLVLVLSVPTVFLFTVVASSKLIQGKSRTVGWMYAALTNGYRDSWEAKWWSSYELLRRLLLIGIAVALPGSSVANLYLVLTFLAIHMFFKPYEKLWQNLLEAVLLLIYTTLLIIRATPSFLDSLTPYSGIAIPEDWNGDLTTTDRVTWLLFPFFYSPLLLGVVFITSAAILTTARQISRVKSTYQVKKARVKTISVNYDFTEIEGVHLRSPDYTTTDFGLDELDN